LRFGLNAPPCSRRRPPLQTPSLRSRLLFFKHFLGSSFAAPYRSNFSPPSTRGTSNPVSRALMLIFDGALDADKTTKPGWRPWQGGWVSADASCGDCSCSALAQTRRALLAKQLTHKTQMSMAEIALAAGFGSVRRFK